MPAGNGTGPMGMGPLTGRGMGRCGGSLRSGAGFSGFGRGRGCGAGFGRGMGPGAGFGYAAPPVSEEERLRILSLQAEQLRARLQSVERELNGKSSE